MAKAPTNEATEKYVEAFAELTNERYRVLEAKLNNNTATTQSVVAKVDTLQSEIYEIKADIRADAATRHQSLRTTIITASAGVIGSVVTVAIALIIAFGNG